MFKINNKDTRIEINANGVVLVSLLLRILTGKSTVTLRKSTNMVVWAVGIVSQLFMIGS